MKLKPNVGTKEVLIALRSCTGLTRVLVNFHGEGDSGDIDAAEIEGLADDIGDMALPAEVEALLETDRPLPVGNIQGVLDTTPNTVQQFLDEWAIDLINIHATWDWYNNDGGGGQLEIEPYSGRVVISGYYNEVVQHPADETDLTIEDDPDFKALTDEERNELDQARALRYG